MHRLGLSEYLNASTPERTDNSTNNLQNETKDNRRGKFSTPGVVERRGGGVTLRITRGTKTGNKVLSLW